jgi:hypothetical protein
MYTNRLLTTGVMFTIEKAPVEVWLQIFERLELSGVPS